MAAPATASPRPAPTPPASARPPGHRLLDLADRLFGGLDAPPVPSRRWALWYVGTAALIAVVAIARRPDAVTTPQFWSEDGYIYFRDDLLLGWRALGTPYRGFPHLLERIIALVGGMVPMVHAPRVYTTAALAVTALALATFVLPGFRHLVRSDGLRAAFGVAAVCSPGGIEALGNPTNVCWYVAIWLFVVSLGRLPRAWWRRGALGALGSLAVWTTPAAPLAAPLWTLRAWWGWRRGRREEVVVPVLLLLALGVVFLRGRGLGTEPIDISAIPGAAPPSVLQELATVSTLVATQTAALVVPPGMRTRLGDRKPGTVAVALLVAVALVAACRRGRWRSLPVLVTAAWFFVGSYAAILAGRPVLMIVMSAAGGFRTLEHRYVVVPAAMLVLAVVALLDAWPEARARRLLGAAAGALLLWAWGPTFQIPPYADLQWPRWASALERKVATGSLEPLSIPLNPRGMVLELDPVAVFPDVDVPAEAIVGSLGSSGTFFQAFTCRCEGLRVIEVALGAAQVSDAGTLRFTLYGPPGNRVVADMTLPRAALEFGGAQAFYLPEVHGSRDQRYAFALHADGNDPAATVYVLGARGDRYPAGEAKLAGALIDADARFQYGCARPPYRAVGERAPER